MLLKSKIRGSAAIRVIFIALLALWVLFLYPNHSPAYAAIAVDNTAGASGNSSFWPHEMTIPLTVTGDNSFVVATARILFNNHDNECATSTATYNGAPMTKIIQEVPYVAANLLQVFVLPNGDADGLSHNLVYSTPGEDGEVVCGIVDVAVASYSGVLQEIPTNATSTEATTGTSAVNIVPQVLNSWIVGGGTDVENWGDVGLNTLARKFQRSVVLLESTLNPIQSLATTTILIYNSPDYYYGGIGAFEIDAIESPTNTISITFPQNTTSTPDFNYWGLSGNALQTNNLIHINWGNSTSSWSGFTNYFLDSSGSFDIDAAKSFTIPTGAFYAQAWITYCPAPYDLYSDCIPSTWASPYGLGLLETYATSTVISFTITGENPYIGGNYGTYYPTSSMISTSTSAEWVMTCDPNDPLWERSFCQIGKLIVDGVLGVLKFVFSPKDSDFQQFTNLKTMLEHKAPMGYFYAIKDALVFNSSTTKAFDLASSTIAMVSPIFNPLKAGITFVLWLLFAFWLFNRIKHFNL